MPEKITQPGSLSTYACLWQRPIQGQRFVRVLPAAVVPARSRVNAFPCNDSVVRRVFDICLARLSFHFESNTKCHTIGTPPPGDAYRIDRLAATRMSDVVNRHGRSCRSATENKKSGIDEKYSLIYRSVRLFQEREREKTGYIQSVHHSEREREGR